MFKGLTAAPAALGGAGEPGVTAGESPRPAETWWTSEQDVLETQAAGGAPPGHPAYECHAEVGEASKGAVGGCGHTIDQGSSPRRRSWSRAPRGDGGSSAHGLGGATTTSRA